MDPISAPGIGSGLDIGGIVDQLVAAERAPVGNRLDANAQRANNELSAIGKLKSALAKFRDAVTTLADIDKFQLRTVAFNTEGVLAASTTPAAAPGFYDVEVDALATNHKLASGAFADTVTPIGTGTLTISSGALSSEIEIVDGANTLSDIRTAINEAPDNPGVVATIVNAVDGAHLVLTARETGAGKAITITQTGGDGGLAAFEFDTGAGITAMNELEAATDAAVTVDGFSIVSGSNSISGAIEGVTLNLEEAAPGDPVRMTIGLDHDAAEKSVNTFVESYNELLGTISELTAYNPETETAGPLLGDAATRSVKSSLRRELSGVVPDTGALFSSLAEIGVTTKANGTVELDDTKIADAITTDFDAVGRLFAGADNGIAVRMESIVGSILDTDGHIENREEAIKAQLDRIDDQRTVLDRRMEAVRERYRRQFDAMDQLVAQLNNTSSFLTQQLANLPKYSSS